VAGEGRAARCELGVLGGEEVHRQIQAVNTHIKTAIYISILIYYDYSLESMHGWSSTAEMGKREKRLTSPKKGG
jgi:hypothetical protein